MLQPALADDAFLADVRLADTDRGRLHLWWLGQSGFLVLWEGRRLLLDPYLSDALTRKYAATDKPHVRMTARVVAPERLDGIAVATASHHHTDHLDADTLLPVLGANPGLRLLVPAAQRAFAAQRLGVSLARLDVLEAGERASLGGFEFAAVPAAHETLDRDAAGRCCSLGYVVSAGPWTIYHSGDTVRYPGMVETLRRWRIDVALLPINGRDPARRVAGNLSGPEAAQLAKDAGVALVIPCHYEMFEFNTASPAPFMEACRQLGQDYRVLRSGERVSRPAPG